MRTPYRVLVFGLPQEVTHHDVCSLAEGLCTGETRFAVDPSGDHRHALAVVDLDLDAQRARRLVANIGRHAVHGRRLEAWLCVMPWG